MNGWEWVKAALNLLQNAEIAFRANGDDENAAAVRDVMVRCQRIEKTV